MNFQMEVSRLSAGHVMYGEGNGTFSIPGVRRVYQLKLLYPESLSLRHKDEIKSYLENKGQGSSSPPDWSSRILFR